MPDKIKEVYESTKDIGLFLDEKDFRDLVSRDPKGVFDIYSKDKNYKDFFLDYNDFENTLGLKKKVQLASGETSFSKSFTAIPSTGELTLSTASQSPSNQPTSISPFVSTGKGNNSLSFKPNLNVWDKSPVGSEIKKEDKNADYLRVKQSNPIEDNFVSYESNRAFESLPAVTKVALNKNKELKGATLKYLHENPQDAAKIQAWQNDKTATGQGIRQEVMQKIYNGVLNEYVPKITEMEKAGVGVQLQNAQKFYGEFNKSIDDLKKAQVKLQFYQNNFLKSKGYEDIVTQGKQLNGKIKEFNIDAWKADSEKILADVNAAKANAEQYIVNGYVPREYQDKYAEAVGQYEYAVNVYNEHNSIPEVQEYNNDIQSLNSLNVESQDLLKEFEGSSDYKKAKDDYAAALQRVESMKPQAEEFKQQQPLFNDYIQTAKKVSDLVGKIELANKGFPAPASIEQTRERITKLYDEGYMNEATLRNWAGVLESLPKAVNSIFAGVGSTLSKLTLGQAGDYNVYDKMADYYDGLNKFNTTILPTMKSYKELKDGTTKWDLAALGFQGMQQIGNMAVFATLGGYGKTAMVATGYMMSRKERENEANEAGLTGIQKEAYISTLSTLEGLSELIMPDNQIFTKELKDLILKDAILAQTKGINWFRKQAFKRIAENTGKEILEEWTVSFGELMQKVAANYDNGNVFDVSKYKDINSWIETAAVTAPLTILGSSYSEINVPKMEMEMARFQAARNLTKSREVLDEMVDTGNMTTEKADAEYKKIVNYAAVQSVMPKDISPAKAVEVSPLIIENKQLEILLESGLDPVFEKQIKDKIKENVTKAEEILSRPEEAKQIDDEELELGIAEAELSRPEEEKESGRKFYQGREFMDATGLKPDYYTQEEVDAAMKARGSKTEATALEETQPETTEEQKVDIERKRQGENNKIENITYNKGVFEGSFLDDYDLIAEGSESTVYRSKDGTHVIKISEPYNSKDEKLYKSRITNNLIREIIGDSGLEVIGYYEHNGVKNPIYKQKFIEGKALSEKEISEYLKTIKGVVEIDGEFYYKYDNKLYAISDFSDNVIQDKNGNIVPVDLDVNEVSDAKINAKYDVELAALNQSQAEALPTEQESKASEPSKSDKNYQEAQEVSSIVSKENPAASVLIQPKGDNLSLTAVYVGKEKRGKGIGTKVLESVKKQADRLGKKVVLDATNELDSETDLERLGNFYEKNGFKKVGENKYEYEPKNEDSSRDIGSRTDTGGTKKSDISTDINKGQPSKKFDSTEEAVSESQAEALPTEKKAQPIEKDDEIIEIPEDELAALEQEIEDQRIEGDVKENIGQKAYLGSEEGMIKMHDTEKNTVVFETNNKIIDLGQLDLVSGRPIASFGLSKFPQEGIKTEAKTKEGVKAIKLDGKEYEIVGRARDKKGQAVVKLKEKETGLIRRLKGEKAERVLKDLSLQTVSRPAPVKLKTEGKEIAEGQTAKEQKLEEKKRQSEARKKAREEFQAKTLEQVAQEEAKSEKLIKEFEKQALEEAVKNVKNTDLVQLGEKIFQVTKKPDGTFTVSQMREDGKLVSIKDAKARKEAIENFKKEKSRKESNEIAQAQKLIDDFKKEEKDRIEKILDKAIDSLNSKGRAFDATIGLPVFVVKSALQIIRASYKSGKALAEAIADGYNHIKKMGYSSVSEFDFKQYALSQLTGKPTESKAETLPKEQESKAKPVQEVPANIQEIADRLDENPTKVQNIYNKYGDKTKDISEITQEDYDKAVKARETSKSKIKMAAIQSKLRQENLSEMEKKAEAKVLKMLKEKDYNQVKEVEDFMKLLPDLQKALLESGEIKTIDCKWGK